MNLFLKRRMSTWEWSLDRLRVGPYTLVGPLWGGTTRAEDAQGTPTQSHISPILLVYEDNPREAGLDPSRFNLSTPGALPDPTTRNLQPCTPNPNPAPQTLTLHFKPETLNHKQ